MAEHYVASDDSYERHVDPNTEDQGSFEDTIVHVDFRPRTTRLEKMQKIGEVVATWWTTEAGAGSLSHVPVSREIFDDGSIAVTFLQYQRGYTNHEFGVPHLGGWSGPETLSALRVKVDAALSSSGPESRITSNYIGKRNLIYIFKDIESRKRTGGAEPDSESLRHELWDKPE